MKRKILIVEDYEDSRSFLKFLLESYGYQVVEAADGIEALESFKKHRPDIRWQVRLILSYLLTFIYS